MPNDIVQMTEAELNERINKTVKDTTAKMLEEFQKKDPAPKQKTEAELEEERKKEEVKTAKMISEACVQSVEQFLKTVPIDIQRQLGYASLNDGVPEKLNFAEMLNGIRLSNRKIIQKYGLKSAKGTGYEVKDASGHMNEATDADGGYLVPAYFATKLINLVELKGTIRPLCTRWPMAGDTLRVPAISGGITTYWVGEGVTKTKSKPTIAQLLLTAKKLIALTTLSDELLEDSNPAVEPALMNLFAIGIANAEDLAFLHGAGSSADPITGIYNRNIVKKAASAGGVSFDDIFDPLGDIENNGAVDITILANPRAKKILRKIKTSNGQYVWGAPSEKDPASIAGYPVKTNRNIKTDLGDAADETALIGGDFSHANIGDRAGLAIVKGYMDLDFENDVTSFRAVKRVAFDILTAALNRFFTTNQIKLV